MRSRLVLLALLAAGALRAEINPANFDNSVKPGDDFYHYADGTWLKTHPIPAAYSSWGAFYEVDDRNRANLHAILEETAKAGHRDRIQQQVGDFYRAGMDEAAIEAAGLAPVQPELDRIAAIKTQADLQAAIAHQHEMGVFPIFIFESEQDPKESTMMIGAGGQGGLGLPERAYYIKTDPKSVQLREKYLGHVARMLVLSGMSQEEARAGAHTVMRIETALAQASKTNVELRDPVANYHRMPLARMQKLMPNFDWPAYFRGVGLAHPGEIDIGQPEFFHAADAMLVSIPVADWRVYLRWNFIHSFSSYLPKAFVDESFDFYGKTLTGALQLRERWKRVLAVEDGEIGEDLGRLYVAKYFPPEAKARMLRMVANLHAAYEERLRHVTWMDEATRAKALVKLAAFGVKIGYPDKWIDYSRLEVDRKSYVGNVMRSRIFNFRRDMNKIGKPKDRTEWGMTPPTVNAYYDPSMNEIVFPAGILQPPFFDAKADDAVNYGGIGAVIGHEMTHGFDDQGRQFDEHGNLTDWWTKESADRFKARAAGIVKQFDSYVVIDGQHVNGELTEGENIADLGGLTISFAAFSKTPSAHSSAKIDDFTPQQRFFLSWATVWRENIRPEALRLQINTDPHSPPQFRVNGPVSNLPAFARAFGLSADSPMVRPPAERVEIW